MRLSSSFLKLPFVKGAGLNIALKRDVIMMHLIDKYEFPIWNALHFIFLLAIYYVPKILNRYLSKKGVSLKYRGLLIGLALGLLVVLFSSGGLFVIPTYILFLIFAFTFGMILMLLGLPMEYMVLMQIPVYCLIGLIIGSLLQRTTVKVVNGRTT